jgi:16S rRNA (adenine1518-N6/adenine1519-N6)-dimethyltransferase
MSTGDTLPPLSQTIAKHGLSAKKSLGQNFLLDLNLTRKIARSAGPLAGRTVIEIGPGPGGLTRALLTEEAARVICIERDERIAPVLEELGAAYPGRLTAHFGDALDVHEPGLLEKLDITAPVSIVANLPYNISTALLVKWLTCAPWPPFFDTLTLMFQREVAERIVARPSTKAYGRLSILSQWRTDAKILFDIPPRAFTPPPKVTSTLVRFDLREKPLAEADPEVLQRVVAAGFSQRRKMLRQSLKSLGVNAVELLEGAGLDPTARAETLSVEDFCKLARTFTG